MNITVHLVYFSLDLFSHLNAIHYLLFLRAVAFSIDDHETFFHLLEHLDEHSVGLLESMEDIYEE